MKSVFSDVTTQVYSDIALLLSQCSNVYSAEVPGAMQELAKQIVDDGLKEMFLSSSNEECIQLMRSEKYLTLKKKMEIFLQRHGHRCVREAEMREKSWHQDPSKLINVLKVILETGSYESRAKDHLTPAQLVSKIKTPLPFIKRKIMQYLLPTMWKAVGDREWGKSLAIVLNDIFKCAYWTLASLMVKEGRLPEEDLLFFLTHYEIGTVIKTRSARLIMKAQCRRKVLHKQMALRFPRLSFGYPKPIERETKKIDKDDGDATAVLKGMPVSRGVVRGPARVVLTLHEARTIQAGDILVVVFTDVGWTPYFPLIAGLVTELGGLVSHGAVVAREYGIPCVVNVPGATVKISNGMLLELNGEKGTLHVL
ncbi:hypothetical protein C0Q70_18585 [Pomacea canaliculata]|uniref:PEP-utilising enzyme mobile domain-containing protein n=1 Tax=Pomacea canaliculata TaxID=400727 RepID=A0A2T7NGY4_POMCA|nr:uncharacterized protein LOC112576576 [Pomacea canaliculata]PVD20430.1 hypothetical protein C0Q70_18585 [Pomacea canaliculata]